MGGWPVFSCIVTYPRLLLMSLRDNNSCETICSVYRAENGREETRRMTYLGNYG